jgi:hypothetical protein
MAGGSVHLKCVCGVEQDRLADFFGRRQCVSTWLLKNSQKHRFGQVGRVLFWEIKSQFAERTLGCVGGFLLYQSWLLLRPYCP